MFYHQQGAGQAAAGTHYQIVPLDVAATRLHGDSVGPSVAPEANMEEASVAVLLPGEAEALVQALRSFPLRDVGSHEYEKGEGAGSGRGGGQDWEKGATLSNKA